MPIAKWGYQEEPVENIDDIIDREGRIHTYVGVELNEIIELDFEGFLDLLEEKILAHGILGDIQYEAVGFEDGLIIVEVFADPTYI